MKQFKFFLKPFNCEDYDVAHNYRFLGVSPMFVSEDTGRNARKMIYVYTEDGTIVPAQTIHEDHDAYHRADVYQTIGNQIFLLPRNDEAKIINLTFNVVNNNENI